MNKIQKFEELLNEFEEKYNKDNNKPEKTFLQIEKVPKSELVSSNILAFYLNPKEEHGLGDLCVKALIKSANISYDGDLNNIRVHREYRTPTEKYMDIVLNDDEIAICIENKIFSGVDNDLENYSDTTNNINANNYKIILSINDESKVATKHNFINLTYKEFCEQLKNDISNVFNDRNKWHIFLVDFINNIENLYMGRRKVNSEMKLWARDNKEKINDIFDFIMNIKSELNEKTSELNRLLVKATKDYKNIDYIWQWNASGIQDENNEVLYTICVIEMKQYKMAIDNYLGLDGWYLDFSFRGRNGYEDKRRKIIDILNDKNMTYDCYDENHIRVFEFDYDEDYSKIVKRNLEVLEIVYLLDI